MCTHAGVHEIQIVAVALTAPTKSAVACVRVLARGRRRGRGRGRDDDGDDDGGVHARIEDTHTHTHDRRHDLEPLGCFGLPVLCVAATRIDTD